MNAIDKAKRDNNTDVISYLESVNNLISVVEKNDSSIALSVFQSDHNLFMSCLFNSINQRNAEETKKWFNLVPDSINSVGTSTKIQF